MEIDSGLNSVSYSSANEIGILNLTTVASIHFHTIPYSFLQYLTWYSYNKVNQLFGGISITGLLV